jgi:hypothetical protein
MTCIPPFNACTIGREGHYCHQPLGHRGDHQCDHRSWPMDLETEIAAQLYLDFYAVYYLDAPEYPPPGAIAAAVQPQGSVWRRMARRAIERAGGGL